MSCEYKYIYIYKLTPFIPHDLCSHVFSPNNRENMFVPLAGSGPLMNDLHGRMIPGI